MPPLTFRELVIVFVNYVQKLIPLIIALTVVTFLYTVVRYYFLPNEKGAVPYAEKTWESSRIYLMYGIIAIFVMVSMWGLVAMVKNTFLQPPLPQSNEGGEFPGVRNRYTPVDDFR